MMTKPWRWCALIGSALAVAAVPVTFGQSADPLEEPALEEVQPPTNATPEEIADFCTAKAAEIADHVTEANLADAELCVEIVQPLVDAGELDKARRIAGWCLHAVHGRSHGAVHAVRRLCRRCSRAIIRAGGDADLVEQVVQACQEQVERVRTSAEQAAEMIRQVVGELPEPPSPPGPDEESGSPGPPPERGA